MQLYQLTYITERPHPLEIKGRMIKQKEPEHRRLAYPIKHIESGYYQTALFEATPLEINRLEKELLENQAVIRHLIVKNPPIEPLRLLQAEVKSERKERIKKRGETKTKEKKVDDDQLEKKLKEILEQEIR